MARRVSWLLMQSLTGVDKQFLDFWLPFCSLGSGWEDSLRVLDLVFFYGSSPGSVFLHKKPVITPVQPRPTPKPTHLSTEPTSGWEAQNPKARRFSAQPKELLSERADPNTPDNESRWPLQQAAFAGEAKKREETDL